MWVCSRLTRAGTRPTPRRGEGVARRSFQPRSLQIVGHVHHWASSTYLSSHRMPRCCVATSDDRCRPTQARSRLGPDCVFSRHAEHFGDAPRLRDAAARNVRRLGVEDLADRAHARLVEVRLETIEQRARTGAVLGMQLQPRVDEGPNQPGPDGALMVRGVARPQVAVVLRPCSQDGRAPASAGRRASAAGSARRSMTGSQRDSSSTG